MTIPAWTTTGILPPFIGDNAASWGVGARSPYRISLSALVDRFATSERKPVFFVRQSQLAQFGIVRLEAAKDDRRLVQTVEIHPVSKETFEQFDEVEVFRQQLASGVYRVWPINDLEPGEYALIDFTPGELDLRVWDFSVVESPPAGAASAP